MRRANHRELLHRPWVSWRTICCGTSVGAQLVGWDGYMVGGVRLSCWRAVDHIVDCPVTLQTRRPPCVYTSSSSFFDPGSARDSILWELVQHARFPHIVERLFEEVWSSKSRALDFGEEFYSSDWSILRSCSTSILEELRPGEILKFSIVVPVALLSRLTPDAAITSIGASRQWHFQRRLKSFVVLDVTVSAARPSWYAKLFQRRDYQFKDHRPTTSQR